MFRIPAALAFALIALSAACSGSGEAKPAARPTPDAQVSPTADASRACTPARPIAAGDAHETMDVGGINRGYILHVPSGYDGAARSPMVLAFHSFAAFADGFALYSKLTSATDPLGFVVVFPEGAGAPPSWNDVAAPGAPDDAAFVKALISRFDEQMCIDENRTFAAGYSNGGGMALRAACELPDRIAAIAIVASTYPNCQADVPLIAFHGLADPVVPFEGGPADPALGDRAFPPVRRVVSEWAQTVGCDGLPVISRPASEIELSTFNRCRGGDGEVLLYSVVGGGHTWPGAEPILADTIGATTQQVSASDLIAAFFSQHPPLNPSATP